MQMSFWWIKRGEGRADRTLGFELPGAEPFHHRRIAMVEEAAGLLVKRGDRGQILGVEHEVEHDEILPHAFLAYRLRDGHDAALGEPGQDNLRNALAVLAPDGGEPLVLEQAVLALGEGAPRFGFHL